MKTIARLFTCIAAAASLASFAATPASALTNSEELTRFGSWGTEAGRMVLPVGSATDPTTGHVYFTDSKNRIDEYTPWGGFVKSFGWDVAPGAVNEQQEVRIRAGAGQYKLGFGASTSPDLAFDAPARESEGPGSVEAALNGLASINSGGGSVDVRAVAGDPNGETPYIYIVTFKGGLEGADVVQLVTSGGTTPLSGGNPSSSAVVKTRADGTAGGTGLESCTSESGCQIGVGGTGAGAVGGASDIAIDSNGNIYVREEAHRIQKFDSAGRFLLMFGGEVNETTGADVCTREDVEVNHDTCGAGTAGPGQGQFAGGTEIAIGATDSVFVADNERIEAFEPDGSYEAEVKVPGELVSSLVVDSNGNFYVVFFSSNTFPIISKENVQKLSPSGSVIGNLKVKIPTNLAIDSADNVFVVSGDGFHVGEDQRVVEFDSTGKQIATLAEPELRPGNGGANGRRFELSALSTNAAGDLYVANLSAGDAINFIRLFGPAPVRFEAPPKVAPTISAQFANSVDRDGAVLGATINPHFWTDTRYYLQYGTGKCSEAGCDREQPVAPGATLTSSVIDAAVASAGVFVNGLEPGTTYHYRFVAESSGGGPVRGIGGEVGSDGKESTFTTFPFPSSPKADCPNQSFRVGLSGRLSDCRAYEMVSPVDKNNGDIKALVDDTGYATALDQSAGDGGKFTYSSSRAFGNPQSAPYTNQFVASRVPGAGWASEAISPPQGPGAADPFGHGFLENKYKAFSADLSTAWLSLVAEPPLAPGAIEGSPTLYRRDNLSGGYETVTTRSSGVEPDSEAELQGTSADGRKAIFRVKDKLTPDASSGVFQLYEAGGGELHLVCVLPNGTPSKQSCSAGTGPSGNTAGSSGFNRTSSVAHAFSDDGSRVYWTTSASNSIPGILYLRENPDQPQSEISGGECSETEKACTVAITAKAVQFGAASADGKKAIFTVAEGSKAGFLEEFDLEAEPASQLIAKKVIGLAGASDDLSYVYFVSTEALEGDAKLGKPNLYLAHEGAVGFIATLSSADTAVVHSLVSNIDTASIYHAAKVSADGRHLVFISTESLTGYDNTDVASGKADSEVYVYEAGAATPLCVSCNPSGARPIGREVQSTGNGEKQWTAASIPAPKGQLYTSRSLSADGSHLFFDSFDALLPADTNGKADVYEWQRATSQKDCDDRGAQLFAAAAEGCLSLISSGESPSDSEFLDASANGEDVFFATQASLLSQDPGLIDIYDARAGGGLPPPPGLPAACEGEACQGPLSPPNDPTPGSLTFQGAGNLREASSSRCPKGKAHRKGRCLAKKKPKKHAQRANGHRRAAR